MPFEAPVSLCGTERMIIIGMPAKPKPIPRPTRKLEMKISHTEASEITSMPYAATCAAAPMIMSTRGPIVRARRPEIGATTIITTPVGAITRVVTISERPKPEPDSTDICSRCGNATLPANIAKPMQMPIRLVSITGRRVAMRRSSRGSLMRVSNQPHSTSTRAPAMPRPRVSGEVQPHSLPREMAMSSPTSPSESSAAPT